MVLGYTIDGHATYTEIVSFLIKKVCGNDCFSHFSQYSLFEIIYIVE